MVTFVVLALTVSAQTSPTPTLPPPNSPPLVRLVEMAFPNLSIKDNSDTPKTFDKVVKVKVAP
jgi:hypothetical protein